MRSATADSLMSSLLQLGRNETCSERDLKSRGFVVMCKICSWNSKGNTWESKEILQIRSNCNIDGKNQKFKLVPLNKDVIVARL